MSSRPVGAFTIARCFGRRLRVTEACGCNIRGMLVGNRVAGVLEVSRRRVVVVLDVLERAFVVALGAVRVEHAGRVAVDVRQTA